MIGTKLLNMTKCTNIMNDAMLLELVCSLDVSQNMPIPLKVVLVLLDDLSVALRSSYCRIMCYQNQLAIIISYSICT